MDSKRLEQKTSRRLQVFWLVLGALALASFSFLAGRQSTAQTLLLTRANQDMASYLVQNDPREMIPLPGPGQGFGLQPGQGEGECPILLYQDGQLFQFMPGQPGIPGMPGQGNQELIPLQPLPGSPQEGPPNVGPSEFSQVPEHLNAVLAHNAN
jgi:hypothetical protein